MIFKIKKNLPVTIHKWWVQYQQLLKTKSVMTTCAGHIHMRVALNILSKVFKRQSILVLPIRTWRDKNSNYWAFSETIIVRKNENRSRPTTRPLAANQKIATLPVWSGAYKGL